MDKTLNKEIATRLVRFGASIGTMAHLARLLGICPSALRCNYVSGRSVPGGILLIKLHNIGCDINWLLTGKGSAPDPSLRELHSWKNACLDEALLAQERIRRILIAKTGRLKLLTGSFPKVDEGRISMPTPFKK